MHNIITITGTTQGGTFDLEIDGLVQERRDSIANALELRLCCTNHRNDHVNDSSRMTEYQHHDSSIKPRWMGLLPNM